MKYLDALKEGGKEAKKSILPDEENKMQSGSREGQREGQSGRRRNNLDPHDPQSLISGTHQQSSDKGGVPALAKELGVDLGKVKGTGPRGTVTEQDVRDAHEQKDKS